MEKFEYRVRSLKMARDSQEENIVPNYLLKPIEIPTNLSLLTEILPKSKKITEKRENSNNSRVNECLSFEESNLLKKSNSILEDYIRSNQKVIII